ncbi:MAG: septum formation initiator family protein [Patescibacteria group bacterium]|nr:septum formation initiator family protein [Patescibacteria group bacterium]
MTVHYGRTKLGKIKKWLTSIVLLLVLMVVVYSLAQSWLKNQEVNSEIVGLQTNIDNLEKENEQYQQLIEYLNSNAYLEEKARTDLGLKKQGEKVVVLPQNLINNQATATDDQASSQSNLSSWINYFFK